jgi:hypothetical protein
VVTTLGLVFLAAYAISLRWGGRGVLAVTACAAPLSDSVMFAAGAATLGPFYFGTALYAGMHITQRSPDRERRKRKDLVAEHPLLVGILGYALLVTVAMPFVLEGVGVIASQYGMDEQVNNLTPLSWTSSNVAQLVYLALNVTFLVVASTRGDLGQSFLTTAFSAGTIVAFSAWLVESRGGAWPHELFDNSPRGFYEMLNPRLRGQYSEASHLGAFALAAAGYFGVMTVKARRTRTRVVSMAFGAAALMCMVEAGSATAFVGGALGCIGLMLIPVASFLRYGATAKVGAVVGFFLMAAALIAATPRILGWATDQVARKSGTMSMNTRSYTNGVALDVLRESWYVGVGLGSSRASSLLLMLLGTIGLVGTGLFLLLLWQAVRGAYRGKASAAAAALTLFTAASFVSLADFASPIMWSLICVGYTASRLRVELDDASDTDAYRSQSAMVRSL